jgi:hypothetical protein
MSGWGFLRHQWGNFRRLKWLANASIAPSLTRGRALSTGARTSHIYLKPGVALGNATNFINQSAAQIVPPAVHAELRGEALTFSNTVRR